MKSIGWDWLVALGLLSATACGAPAEGTGATGEGAVGSTTAALTADATTNSKIAFICSESSGFYLVFETTAPATVAPSEVFPATVHAVNLIPPTVAPFAGTFSSSLALDASPATPANEELSLGSFHFTTGQILGDIGSATTTLTAPATVGAPVVLGAGPFDYTITGDSGSPEIHGHCVPPTDPSPTLATIPVVSIPTTKDECKGGGFQTHTDDAGNPFKNEGLCIDYVLH